MALSHGNEPTRAMSTHSVVVGTLAAVAILNFAVSILIVVSRASARRQKDASVGLDLVFPLIGAIGLGLFISVQGNM